MIKEDFVSFDVAKLLKEKGFDAECDYEYGVPVVEQGYVLQRFYKPIKNSELIDGAYAAPTLQMAMKWLMEIHKIFIQIALYSKLDDYCFEVFQNTHRLIVEKDDVYNSYEAACEAAIKYCLKLI